MSLIIDVNFGGFKQFMKQDRTFFYTEETTKFVLVKPFETYFVRCYIIKSGESNDFLFKERWLVSSGAMPVHKFNFDKEEVVVDRVRVNSEEHVDQDNEEVKDTEVDGEVDG